MTRPFHLVIALALVLPAAAALEAMTGVSMAHADDATIAVGTELVATADVTLHTAEIAKGSRVSVTKVVLRQGRVDGIDVALADGHVVMVTMTTIRSYFRIAE